MRILCCGWELILGRPSIQLVDIYHTPCLLKWLSPQTQETWPFDANFCVSTKSLVAKKLPLSTVCSIHLLPHIHKVLLVNDNVVDASPIAVFRELLVRPAQSIYYRRTRGNSIGTALLGRLEC